MNVAHHKNGETTIAEKEAILVVDDEASQRRLLSAILGERGYDILEAATGEDAGHRRPDRLRPGVIVRQGTDAPQHRQGLGLAPGLAQQDELDEQVNGTVGVDVILQDLVQLPRREPIGSLAQRASVEEDHPTLAT